MLSNEPGAELTTTRRNQTFERIVRNLDTMCIDYSDVQCNGVCHASCIEEVRSVWQLCMGG